MINKILLIVLVVSINFNTTYGQDLNSEPNTVGQIEEILVTATRRVETDILTTPIPMTALNDNMIEKYAPRDLQDMALMTPGLSAGTVSAFKSASFAMRGLYEGTIILYKETPVAVTIDDFVIPHMQTQALEMFDIEQVEVLRGPQGTLFGKNTTAGVVNVKTKQPVLNELFTDIELEYGDFGTQQAKIAVNVPISDDKLAFRIAAMYLKSDGYYKNGAKYGPLPDFVMAASGVNPNKTGAGDGSSVGGDDVLSGRAKLLWEPNENLSAVLTYEMIRDEGDTAPIVNDSPDSYIFSLWGFTNNGGGDPYGRAGVWCRGRTGVDMCSGHQVDVDGIYLNVTYDFGDYTLHSVTGRREQESRLAGDYVGNPGPFSLFDATRDDDRETFQQEFRLASDFDGNFNFVTGVFYQTDDTQFCVNQVVGFLDFFGLGTPPGFFQETPQTLCNENEVEAMAAFIDGTWDISDRLHLSAGLRLTSEEKSWTGRPRIAWQSFRDGGFDPSITADTVGDKVKAGTDWERFPYGVVRDSEKWEEPSYRINLSYDFSEDHFGYVSYARGFKSGGYNDQTGTQLNPIIPAAARPVNPEFADSIEIGLKSSLLDNTANLSVNAFFVEYEDAQRTLNASFPSGQETLFFNAADMEAEGFEWEYIWRVNPNFTVLFNGTKMDVKYKKFAADTNFDGIIDVDFSDQEPQRSPEWMYSLDLNYVQNLSNGGELEYNFLLSHEDESLHGYADGGPQYNPKKAEHDIINLSLKYTDPEDKYWVRLIGKNVTDEVFTTGALSVATLWIMSAYNQPSYYAIQVGARF